MEILANPHWETLSASMRRILSRLEAHPFLQRFYLAGGTALALQIGHRISVDLDYFSYSDELLDSGRREIIFSLLPEGVEVIENSIGNLVMLFQDVRIGFFSYGFPLVQELITINRTPLANIADIGLMKCDALVSRGSRKDFYDLFFIDRILPFEELFKLGPTKYAVYRDFAMLTIEHMLSFENADRDVQPQQLLEIEWEEVRQFFITRAASLGKTWLIG